MSTLCFVPRLAATDLRAIGAGVARSDGPSVWIRTGRRLEVTAAVPLPGGGAHLAIVSEIGRARLEPLEPDEAAALERLRRADGLASVEQVLCDEGLVRLYRVICVLRGGEPLPLSTRQLIAKALSGRCAECARAVSFQCAWLGDLAQRCALMFGASGGVYLAGEFAPALGEWLARSPFRRRFDGPGAGAGVDLLRTIPTSVLAPGWTSPGRASFGRGTSATVG